MSLPRGASLLLTVLVVCGLSALGEHMDSINPSDMHFEDMTDAGFDTALKASLCVLVIVAIINTQLWSVVSWFVQFKRMFAVCFFISIIWNWFYLYKIAFAEHQNNIVQMESFSDKCTGGVKATDWSDGLKEWFRKTWTLQDDPCKRYYEVLMVNPILLVPPTNAISLTITTFVTEPLKHIGKGISELLRALLKDLPVTLQIPVLLFIIIIVILVFMYAGIQAALQHAITPWRGPQRDPLALDGKHDMLSLEDAAEDPVPMIEEAQ